MACSRRCRNRARNWPAAPSGSAVEVGRGVGTRPFRLNGVLRPRLCFKIPLSARPAQDALPMTASSPSSRRPSNSPAVDPPPLRHAPRRRLPGLMMRRLEAAGFALEPMRIEEVDNFWARRGGDGPVLSPGHRRGPHRPAAGLAAPTFDALIDDQGMLSRTRRGGHERQPGVDDRRRRALRRRPPEAQRPSPSSSPATRGRPGPPRHQGGGRTPRRTRRAPDWCIVGEPSRHQPDRRRGEERPPRLLAPADHPRRTGPCGLPAPGEEPIHLAARLAELAAEHWDDGNAFFPPEAAQ